MPVIRRERQVFASAIGVASMDTGGADLANVVAGEADRLSGEAFRLAAEDAEKSGIDLAQAMEEGTIKAINPETGMPEALTQPSGGRIARQAFERVVDKRFQEAIDRDLRFTSKRLAMDNPDPGAYKAAFSSYIAGLGENAVGKYGEFVKSTGSAVLASTELTLIGQARSRARAAASAGRSAGNKEAAALLYSMGKAGMTPEALELLGQRSGMSADEITAGLTTPGAMAQVDSKLKGALAEGQVLNLLSQYADDETTVEAINLAISSGGTFVAGVPEEAMGQLETVIGLTDVANMAAVSGEASRLTTQFGKRFAAAVEEEKAQQVYEQRLGLVEAKMDAVNFEADVAGTLSQTLQRTTLIAENVGPNYASVYGDTPPTTRVRAMVTANIEATSDMLGGEIRNLNEEFLAEGSIMNKSDWEAQSDDMVKAWVRPYATVLASGGNIEDLTAAAEGDVQAMARLAPEQRIMMKALRSTDEARLNRDLVKDTMVEVFSEGDAAAREKMAKETERLAFEEAFTGVKGELQTGVSGTDTTAIQEITAQVATLVNGGYLTSTQGAAKVQEAKDAWAIGVVNAADTFDDFTSADFNDISAFLSTGGSDAGNLSATALIAARAILDETGGDLDEVQSHLTKRREQVVRDERAIEDAREEQSFKISLLNGEQPPSSKPARESADAVINEIAGGEVDWFSQSSVNPELYGLMEQMGLPGQTVTEGVIRLADGNPNTWSGTMFEHYANLSQVARNDRAINLFRGAIPDEKIKYLDEVMAITQQMDVTPAEVVATLYDTKGVDIDVVMPDGPRAFVADVIGKRKSTEYTLDRLTPIAFYLAKKSMPVENIEHALENLGDMFMKSDFGVLDLDEPIGEKSYTDMAPERILKDQGELDEMVRQINFAVGSEYQFGVEYQRGKESPFWRPDRDKKPVYMVPDKTSGREAGIWNLYTTDKYGTLTPLFVEVQVGPDPADVELQWPQFNANEDLDVYRRMRARDVVAESQQVAREAQELKVEQTYEFDQTRSRIDQLWSRGRPVRKGDIRFGGDS